MFVKFLIKDLNYKNSIINVLKKLENKVSNVFDTFTFKIIDETTIKLSGQEMKKVVYTIKWIDDEIDHLFKNDFKFSERKYDGVTRVVISETEINNHIDDFKQCLWVAPKYKINDFLSFSLIEDPKSVGDSIKFGIDFYEKFIWSKVTTLKTKNEPLKIQVVQSGNKIFTITWKNKISKNMKIRIHHQCETSEIHGSIHCDCKLQLDDFYEKMFEYDDHMLIYCHEEGRGAGLVNKINAYYNTEIHGDDTVEAFDRLNLRHEQRKFEIPADIIYELGIKKVMIVTNNPKKYEPLIARRINVTRVSTWLDNYSNEAKKYVDTKIEKMGHLSNE